MPTAWRDTLVAREARRRPERIVTLHLSYNQRYFPEKLHAIGSNPGEMAAELGMIASFDKGRPTQKYPDPAYMIRTPKLWLRVAHVDRDGVVIAQIVDVGVHDAALLPAVVPHIRARVYSVDNRVSFDLHQAHANYKAATADAVAAARQAVFGEAPRTPRQRSLDELDRQLLPALTILNLVAKREEVVGTASAEGVVVLADDSGTGGGESGVDVMRIRLDTVSGAFVEDANVGLDPGDGGEPISAEIVEASADEVLVRPKRYVDLDRLPQPDSRVSLTRKGESKSDRAVASAIARARQGTVVGDWDGLTRLLTDPGSLPAVRASEDSAADPQADAVSRALAARQAFFIQGPPGTGKTTVITEIVRRLAERGERVLLVAPMHVAVDEVLHRLRDDERIWPMRVASDASKIRSGLEHLRENAIQAGAADRVLARLGRPRDDWPAEIARLHRRRETLERLRGATEAHEQAAGQLARLREAGECEILGAESDRLDGEAADLAERIAAAGSTAKAAAVAAQRLGPELRRARERAAETTAHYDAGGTETRERAKAHSAVKGSVEAARKSLAGTAERVASSDARLTAIPGEMAKLRQQHRAATDRDIGALDAYLAEREGLFASLRQQHQDAASRNVAALDTYLTERQVLIARLRQQHQDAVERLSALEAVHAVNGRHLMAARDAALRADVDYRDAYAGSGPAAKIAGGLGFGALGARRAAMVGRGRESAAVEREYATSERMVSQIRAQIQGAWQQAAAGQAEFEQAGRSRAQAYADYVRQAAEFERCQTRVGDFRGRLARSRGVDDTLTAMDDAAREIASRLEILQGEARAAQAETAAWCEGAASRIRARIRSTQDRLTAGQAELDQVRHSREQAYEDRTRQLAELEVLQVQAAQLRERLTEAQNAESALAAANHLATEAVTELEDEYGRADAAGREAASRRAALEAELADRLDRREVVRRRLAEATETLQVAADRASEGARLLHEARRAALEACDGKLPDDLAADATASLDRIDRLSRLIRLDARWRRLIDAADSESGKSVEQLGRAVLDATNLVCSTVAGIAGSPSARDADFDTLILDEASRVIDAEFLVPAVRARRWILVGDERQLPPYVDQETEQHIHALLALRDSEREGIGLETAVERIAQVHDGLLPRRALRRKPTVDLAARMEAEGSWAEHYREDLGEHLAKLDGDLAALPGGDEPFDARASLLTALAVGRSVSRFEKCVTLPQAAGVRARLTTQRRMIAPIAELVNVPVYGGAYITPPPEQLAEKGIRPFIGAGYSQPVVFYDTERNALPSRTVGTGFVNDFEADLIVKLLHVWDRIAGQGDRAARPSFSVLAFYKAQAALIERRLARRPLRRLTRNVIDSIDKIQGQESDLVVISFVRSLRDDDGRPRRPRPGTALWLQDIHRLNVAVTRARLALALVGDRRTLSRLAGDKEAEGFYANLFGLMDRAAPGMLYVKDSAL